MRMLRRLEARAVLARVDALTMAAAMGWVAWLWSPVLFPESRDTGSPARSATEPALTLGDLTEKPLFDPGRQRYVPPPPPPAVASAPPPPPPPPPGFAESHVVKGVARNGDIRIVFVSEQGQAIVHPLKVGDRLGTHVVREIGVADVTFDAEDGQSVVLPLPRAATR